MVPCVFYMFCLKTINKLGFEVNCNKKTGQAMKAQGISIFSFTHKKRLLNRHRKKSIDRTILRFWHCEDRSQFEEGSEPEKGMNKGSNSRQKL